MRKDDDAILLQGFVRAFRGHHWESKPLELWQHLFDFYREKGCPLDRMSNMLIDLRNCTDACQRAYDGTVQFLWGINPGNYETTWINEDQWFGLSLETVATLKGFDWYVLCELTKDEARFSLLPMP